MRTNRYPGISDEHAAALVAREPFEGLQSRAYYSEGGTYIYGSAKIMNDDGNTRDLFAILPNDQVIPLWFTANPAPVERILADAREEGAR